MTERRRDRRTFQVGRSVAGEPLRDRRTFQVGRSVAGEPLRDWGNQELECALTHRKPAHTPVLFAYS